MSVYLRLVAMLAWIGASTVALATTGGGNSSATISAAFADSCRGFAAHSSKDISHVELHYGDGRVVKHEISQGHDYAIQGGPGDELEAAIVKSGTTRSVFECAQAESEPVARLEILTPPYGSIEGCGPFWAGGLICEGSTPRTDWTDAASVPDTGGGDSGLFHWGCGWLTDWSHCPLIFTFRGIGSSDADGDIVSWTIDFGDGTSASGDWNTAAPAQISHDYSMASCGTFHGICVVTLTVTDSAGHSAAASLRMVLLDLTLD